jgi:MoaA/NifB/PqqE/SkfB family radical SAM enzyme
MGINQDTIHSYNKTRNPRVDKTVLCHAPWKSIIFTQNGDESVCCYNKQYILGTYPNNSIHEMWFGKVAQTLRSEMHKNPLPNGCQNCSLQIESKNYASVHARHFDFHSDNPIKHLAKKSINYIRNKIFTAYPRVIEFELSNTCNLECIMCNGYFSSSIRKNKENLPPLKMVYDENFVSQLEEFIPHLTDAKFLGGEPFLIPIFYKIWEKIVKLNPRCKIHITTNATMIKKNGWEILYNLKANIVVSIDSLIEDKYEKIRKGANFKEVNENIHLLKEYTKQAKTHLNFSVCPMTENWDEMPTIIQYGINNEIFIYFNTLFYPENLSLKNIDKELVLKIINYYENSIFYGNGFFFDYNQKQLVGLSNMLKYWHQIE